MHPPLTQHKHPGCYDLIVALEACHAAGLMARFSGACNATKQELTLCLRAERLDNQRQNQKLAKARRDRVADVWRKIDEES